MADPLRPLDPSLFDYWCAQHLLNRAGFGGTPSQVRALANMGLSKAVDSVVNYEAIEADPVQTDLFDKDIMQPRSRSERLAIQRAREAILGANKCAGILVTPDTVARRVQEGFRVLYEHANTFIRRGVDTMRASAGVDPA